MLCSMVTRAKTPRTLPASAIPKGTAAKGRPSTYKAEFCILAERLTLAGFTLPQLAEVMGVATSSISKWMCDHPSFSDAITRARKPADGRVVDSLFKRANGYEYHEQHPIKMKNADGSERIELVEVRKHLAGDVNAQRYWVNNRLRELWKNVPEEKLDDGKEAISKVTVSVQTAPAKPITTPEPTPPEAPDA